MLFFLIVRSNRESIFDIRERKFITIIDKRFILNECGGIKYVGVYF